jgi:hypothetical protein
MGILRTAAVLGAGYFLYKKFNENQKAESAAWEDSYPAEPASVEESSDLLAESATDATLGGTAPNPGRH